MSYHICILLLDLCSYSCWYKSKDVFVMYSWDLWLLLNKSIIIISKCYYFTLNCSFTHRMTSEHKKLPEHLKSSKPWCALHHYQDENKDPQKSAMGRKAPVRPGISRLPVLAKSLHLQTPSDFSQSHCKWEEKPLAVSVAFSSSWLIKKKVIYYIRNTLAFSSRAKLRRKSRPPGLYLSACHIPRFQERPLKMSSHWLLHNQGLALTRSSIMTILAMFF